MVENFILLVSFYMVVSYEHFHDVDKKVDDF